MTLVTRVAVSVKPNVQNGDDLDIRPYCKVKVIPGGQLKDSCFVSGVVCHKNVSHKAMAREIINPRIMLLSGGIEFTRKENTIASLDTLLQQENEFLQILVQKLPR
jgi:1-phosphatidylinositol-3-phosphate 5-kinase